MFDLPCGIRLRAFRAPPAPDLDAILSLYNAREVAPLITKYFPVPRGEKVKDEFKQIIDHSSEMVCIIETIPKAPTKDDNDPVKAEPQFVGITALWVHHPERGNRHSDYSILMLPEFWNRGYGKEITGFMINHAFIHLNMHRISLEVFEGNDRAVSVYKKL